MNKTLKTILIVINVLMLVTAILWFLEKQEKEPFGVCLGQIATLILLVFEKQASTIITKNITNSKVKIRRKDSDLIHTEKVKDSTIDIQ